MELSRNGYCYVCAEDLEPGWLEAAENEIEHLPTLEAAENEIEHLSTVDEGRNQAIYDTKARKAS